MKKLNFKELPIRLSISSQDVITMDVKEQFANLVYTQTSGVASHALALKIFNSDGLVELDDSESDILKDVVGKFCTPAVIDSVNDLLEINEEI